MRHIVFGLFIIVAVYAAPARAAAAPSPLPSITPVPGATPTAAASASAVATATPAPSPSPIIPPHDAPAVKSTTPPFAPASVPATPLPPENMWLGSGVAISLPMMTHGERPFIQALINGHPGTLVVDTGAAATTIDAGWLDDAPTTNSVSLQIGELRFPHLPAVKADVRSYTQRYFGTAADGIIGGDLLAHYPVALDFPNRTMTIFRDSRGAAAAEPPGTVTLTLRVIDGVPAIAAAIDSQPPDWFAFGTGASLQVQIDPLRDHARHLARAEHSLPFQEPGLAGNATGSLVRARSLSIGSLTFNQPLAALLSAPRAESPELAGTLGAMMLSRLSLLIDEPSSTAYIIAPPGATAARLYDPSGVTLEMRGDTIVVRSVAPGTQAEAAHIRPGDEIVSINGLAPATLDFARQLLDGSPGAKIQLVYRRWHLNHSATLTLRVII